MYNIVNGYGAAVLSAIYSKIPTFGKIFVVCASTDPNFGKLREVFRDDPEGQVMIYNDVNTAYGATVDGRNDIVALTGNASHTVTAMMDVTKSRVHFVGINPGDRGYGQAAKIVMGVTTAATDLGAMKNTGVRNSFINIKFDSGNTKAESLYTVVEAGEYAYYENCEFYKSTDLDETGAAELLLNGDSAQFKNCTIGSSANEIVGAVIRPCVLVTATISGKKCRDASFVDCKLMRKCGNVANRFVYGANATDVERLLEFKNCLFYNSKLASADPAQAIAFGATQTGGDVVVYGTSAGVNVTKISTTTGVTVVGPAINSGAFIGVNAA